MVHSNDINKRCIYLFVIRRLINHGQNGIIFNLKPHWWFDNLIVGECGMYICILENINRSV